MVVLNDDKGHSEWLLSSHLAGPGLDMNELATLPARSNLLVLASLDADKELHTGDRNTITSQYQQRGVEHASCFLKTALKNMHAESESLRPTLIVDSIAHVGDMALAAQKLRLDPKFGRLHYLGLGRDSLTAEFASNRVKEEMALLPFITDHIYIYLFVYKTL